MAEDANTRCGFVAIIGAPNAGKSTLLNAMVGSKLAIVTHKAQTTRAKLRGIVVSGASQIVLVDTPGIFAPRRRLDRAMVTDAWSGAADADVVLLLIDAHRPEAAEDGVALITTLREHVGAGRPVLLVLNKIDLLAKEKLLALTDTLNAAMPFADTFMISALAGDGVPALVADLAARMPEGPWMFPADDATDQPLVRLCAELTREQLLLQVHDELPYQLTVEPESWENFKDGSVKISQVVFVRRETHRVIVIGQGGQRIRAVRVAAQQEMAELVGRRVHLFLHVKVKEDWEDRREHYTAMGLDWQE